MHLHRGDVFMANLDPVVGFEQAGTRPVLVVQCDQANERIPTVTVVPLTSNLRAGRFLIHCAYLCGRIGIDSRWCGPGVPHPHVGSNTFDPQVGTPQSANAGAGGSGFGAPSRLATALINLPSLRGDRLRAFASLRGFVIRTLHLLQPHPRIAFARRVRSVWIAEARRPTKVAKHEDHEVPSAATAFAAS